MHLTVITLRTYFLMYWPVQFINYLIFHRTIAENYIHIRNMKSFFEYCDVIKYGQGHLRTSMKRFGKMSKP